MTTLQPIPYYEAYIQIGALQIPAMPGMSLTAPQNWVVPPMIGNRFPVNVGKGARNASIDVSLIVRDKATEALSTSFLGLFNTRGSLPYDNTAIITGGITFWNGNSGFIMKGAKPESISLACSYGEDIQLNCRFVGSDEEGLNTCLTVISTPPTLPSWDCTPELRFDACNFSSPLTNEVWRFGLSYSNNHRPSKAMHGGVFPIYMNAGQPSAAFNIMVQELASVPSDESAVTLSIAGTAFTRNFTLNRIKDNTPNNLSVEVPESMRMHDYLCLSDCPISAGILTIT